MIALGKTREIRQMYSIYTVHPDCELSVFLAAGFLDAEF